VYAVSRNSNELISSQPRLSCELFYVEHFCRAMLCKRGLCHRDVSVRLSRSWILSKRINVSSKFFHHQIAALF